MTRLSRRAFIAGGVTATTVALPISIMGVRALPDPEATVMRYLRTSVPGLRLADPELLGFARTYLAKVDWSRGKSIRMLLALDNPALLRVLPKRFVEVHDRFTRQMITDFLFSTDFFTIANRQAGATQYLAYADPYAIGCRNPLATFDLDAPVA